MTSCNEKYVQEAQHNIKIGLEVLTMRKILGFTQSELAKEVGTSQRVISNIEHADYNPGSALLARIGKALNFTQKNWANIYEFPSEEVKDND